MGKREKADESLKKDDVVLLELKTATAWFEKHFKTALSLVALVLFGILMYSWWSDSQEVVASESTELLRTGIEKFQAATEINEIYTATSAESLTKKLNEAESEIKKAYLHPNSGNGVGNLKRIAAYYLANIALRKSEFAESAKYFQEYVSPLTSKESIQNDPIAFLALENLGYSLEGQGKNDEALLIYERLENEGPSFYQDYALKHRARVLTAQGKEQDAQGLYKKIIARDPASPLKDFAESKLNTVIDQQARTIDAAQKLGS